MRTPTHSFALSPQPKVSDSPHPTPAESAKSATFTFQLPSHIPTFSPLSNPKLKIKNQKLGQSHRLVTAFTLIELMAATTVLSVILLLMVGMQDQMSKAWSNANRRTDATREARAACMLMARDLSTFAMRGKAFGQFDSFRTNLTSAAVPFYYFNGSGGIAPGGAPNCAQFFGLIPQASKGTDPADIALVGYYIALATNTNVSGFTTTSWNLFRYYIAPSNAAAGIATWLPTPNGTATALFTNIATNSEILARNACNLQIIIYGSTTANSGQITNGLNFSNNGSTSGFYRGNKLGLELSLYPEDMAQRITNSLWMNTANIQKYARSFEFKIDCPKN
jgi:type II secretory pathway pseudopilin PulG